MNKLGKTIAALGLSAALLFGCAACSSQTGQTAAPQGQDEGFSTEDTLQAEPNPVEAEPEEATPAAPAEPEPEPQENSAPAEEGGIADKSGIGDDTILLTVNGDPVRWREFRYWLFSGLGYQGVAVGEDTDWDAPGYNEMTLREYAIADALNSVVLYKVVDQTAEQMGLTLTEEDEAEIDGIMASNVDYLGDEESFRQYLRDNYLTEELMRSMIVTSYHYSELFEELFGPAGEKLSESEVLLYGQENDYFRAKHILLSATDEAGEPYSEEEMAEKYARLQELLDQLRASEEPTVLFDELMQQYSEDPGVATYPDGYQFRRGDMVPEFQEAVDLLEDYDISDVIQMDYGYSIVMRLPLDPEAVAVNDAYYGYTLRYNAASYVFSTLVQSWIAEAEVEFTDAYEQVDPAAVF